jgi:hypothetical protein
MMDVATEADGEMAPYPARLHPGVGGERLPLVEVTFRTPLVHDSDHRAVVTIFHSRGTRRLTKYHQQQQRFPLWLPPRPHDGLMHDFEALRLMCEKPKPKR